MTDCFVSIRHAEGRREYAKNYVGYHQPKYHPGHKQAAEEAETNRKINQGHADQHQVWEPVRSPPATPSYCTILTRI